MSFRNFINMNCGEWMTQKTVYKTKDAQISLYKSKISINKINLTSNNISDISLQNQVKSGLHRHYMIQDLNTKKINYIDTMINQSQITVSKIINYDRNTVSELKSFVNTMSHICILHNHKSLYTLEKLWLVNSNLRLGITLTKKHNKCVAICFSSDIRIN